jgi:hypothetical protein
MFLVAIDHGPHRLTVERLGQLSRLQSVDELDFPQVPGILHEIENGTLDDQVLEVL